MPDIGPVSITIRRRFFGRVKQIEARLKEEFGLTNTYIDNVGMVTIWGEMDRDLLEEVEKINEVLSADLEQEVFKGFKGISGISLEGLEVSPDLLD